jgi:hypothetical protein
MMGHENMTRWYLIRDRDVVKIKAALLAPTHAVNDYNCEDWPIGEGCRGCKGDEQREAAVHTLDSGLHLTDAVPADYLETQLDWIQPDEKTDDYMRRHKMLKE